jgi:hypothetical protein
MREELGEMAKVQRSRLKGEKVFDKSKKLARLL